jgi:uncharacterized membrane protein
MKHHSQFIAGSGAIEREPRQWRKMKPEPAAGIDRKASRLENPKAPLAPFPPEWPRLAWPRVTHLSPSGHPQDLLVTISLAGSNANMPPASILPLMSRRHQHAFHSVVTVTVAPVHVQKALPVELVNVGNATADHDMQSGSFDSK